MEPEFLRYCLTDSDCVLEQEPLRNCAEDGQLMVYRHGGFWQPMDTFREYEMLNRLWASGKAPWKTWKD
jgi:glucose-1-phosphate cytidylyltransferase